MHSFTGKHGTIALLVQGPASRMTVPADSGKASSLASHQAGKDQVAVLQLSHNLKRHCAGGAS